MFYQVEDDVMLNPTDQMLAEMINFYGELTEKALYEKKPKLDFRCSRGHVVK